MKICARDEALKPITFGELKSGSVFKWDVSDPDTDMAMKLSNGGYVYLESGMQFGDGVTEDQEEVTLVDGCFIINKEQV